MNTTCTRLASSRRSTSSDEPRDDFARAAVFEEFRPRDGKALDQANFVDRRPHEQPRPAPEAWQRETDSSKWPGLVTRRAA